MIAGPDVDGAHQADTDRRQHTKRGQQQVRSAGHVRRASRPSYCHRPPGRPTASAMTLRPARQSGAATTSLPLGSAATSPAGKS